MLHLSKAHMAIFLLGLNSLGCKTLPTDMELTEYRSHNTPSGGVGGGDLLTLPFPSGKWWTVTQKYNTGSHVDYGGTYSDDRYALDFSRLGCEDYGEPITPVLPGTVSRIWHDDGSGTGYGNSVLIVHGSHYASRYAHLSEILVTEGEYLDTHEVLGLVGNTGHVVGSACPEHPGTHLHLSFYEIDEDWNFIATPPEPMSGADLQVGCWYNREGDSDCSRSPEDYEPEDDYDWSDEEGEYESEILNVRMLEVSPRWGVEDETLFTWASVINSPDGKPDVTLSIHNPHDDENYEFEMTSESEESPYVFTFQKELRDEAEYSFWVEAEYRGEDDRSGVQEVETESRGDIPELYHLSYSPSVGFEDETEFDWSVSAWSSDRPELMLKIVNPEDAEIYSFPMDVDGDDHLWTGEFSKVMRDSTIYPFWVEAMNRDGGNTTRVESIEVRP